MVVNDRDWVSAPLAPKNNVIEGKPDLSLLPMDLLEEYLVPAYQEGLLKYRRESWRLGFPVSVMMAAAMRHMVKFFWHRESWDPDATALGIKKHHLAGAIFSLLAILWTLKVRGGGNLDDRMSVVEIARGAGGPSKED